jgi:LPXTG-motif cell wall-anchored protein
MNEMGKYQLKPYRQRALPALLTVAIMLTSSPASFANTAPNAYEPAGESWVDVSESEKVYLENFGFSWDDDSIYYVGNGIECTFEDVTANGPFLSAYDGLDDEHCTDSEDSPIDPIGDSDTLGAIPFGFTVDFFGTEYDSAWPNTNGGIFFEAPDSAYNLSMGQLAFEAQSSVMFAFGADLYYYDGESNFWTAQTTVDGKDAVVFSWENFHNCCSESSDEDMSFQIVLINFGAGDFNAYFNYESVNDFSEGYSAESIFIDLATGVSPGSNVFFSEDASFITADTCIEGIWDDYFSYGGDMTDSLLFDELDAGAFFFKVNDAENGLVSIWEDEACSEPIRSNLVQDIAVDGHAYLEFSADAYEAVAVGWATFDPVNFELDWTELLRNVDASELENDADSPLVERSLNTSVPGRFVIGQRGGATVVDSASITPAPAAPAPAAPAPAAPATITPTLAATGANVEWLIVAGLLAGLAGSGFLAFSRRKRIW